MVEYIFTCNEGSIIIRNPNKIPIQPVVSMVIIENSVGFNVYLYSQSLFFASVLKYSWEPVIWWDEMASLWELFIDFSTPINLCDNEYFAKI